jgi:hypothetical protein
MVQVPAATRVTVALENRCVRVQTDVVCEVNPTTRPEDEDALIAMGAVPRVWFESGAKMMTWLPCVTWKLWFAGGAAAQSELPGCVAWMVQVPTVHNATVAVLLGTVQTEEVVEAKFTASPDDAVALTINCVGLNGSGERAAKVMVWLAGVTWKLWLKALAGA